MLDHLQKRKSIGIIFSGIAQPYDFLVDGNLDIQPYSENYSTFCTNRADSLMEA